MSSSPKPGPVLLHLGLVGIALGLGSATGPLGPILTGMGASGAWEILRNDFPAFLKQFRKELRVNGHLAKAFARALVAAGRVQTGKRSLRDAFAKDRPDVWGEIGHRDAVVAIENFETLLKNAAKGKSADLGELCVSLEDETLQRLLEVKDRETALAELENVSGAAFADLPAEFRDWLLIEIGDLVQACFWEELKKNDGPGTAAWRAFQRLIFQDIREDLSDITDKLDTLARCEVSVAQADLAAAIDAALQPLHEKIARRFGETLVELRAELAAVSGQIGKAEENIKRHTTEEADRIIAELGAQSEVIPFDKVPGRSEVGLVGRVDAVARLVQNLVEPGAREFVIAPGGYGKSAVAASAVHDQLCRGAETMPPNEPFPGGVGVVNLYQRESEVTESTVAWHQIATAWNVDLDRYEGPEGAARHALTGRRALLVIEGAERAHDLEELLSVCDGATSVLVLTRREAQLPDASARRAATLPPLGEAESRELLLRHAGPAYRDHDGEHGTALDALVRETQCIPLLLRWAGASLNFTADDPADYLASLQRDPLGVAHPDPKLRVRENATRFFQRSLDQVSARHPLAPEVAAVVGALAPQAFPVSWVAAALDLAPAAANQVLATLTDFGLLQREGIGRGLRYGPAHAFVHSFARSLSLPNGAPVRLESALDSHLRDFGAELGVPYSAAQRAFAEILPHLRSRMVPEAEEKDLHLGQVLTYRLVDIAQEILPAHATLSLQIDVWDLISERYQRLAQDDPANSAWQRDLSVSLEKLGNLAVARGNLEQAQQFFQQALEIRERLAQDDPANSAWQRDLSVSLEKLGNLAVARGNLEQAQQFFQQALEIRERLAQDDPANSEWQRDLSVSLSKLGDLAVARGNLEQAQQFFQQALEIRERLAQDDPANSEWQRDLSVSLNKLGELAVARGNLEQAQQFFQQALEIRERLAQDDPANSAWQRDLSVSLNKLGELAVARGNLEQAQQFFQQALEIRERLAQDDPANSAWQRDLSVSLEKLGNLAVARGNLEQAQQFFQQALEIRERLAQDDPANSEWQRDLSVSLEKLGELAVARGNLEQAQQFFQQALEIRERLAQDDPANSAWQRDLSVSLNKLGELAVARGNLEQAQQFFQQALEIRERLAQDDPANSEWQRDLVVSEWKLADLAVKNGQEESAVPHWTRCLAILRGMKESGMHFDQAMEQVYARLEEMLG